MRVLRGKKVVEAPADWRSAIERSGRPVILDLGAGDGRYAYECAGREPDSVYVAIDPDTETLSEYAFKASRKPARGGRANVEFVVAAVEALPVELAGLAELVRVNFPWGSLMRGLLEPKADVLDAIAGLLRDEGRLEVIASYDPEHDTNAFAGEPLPVLDSQYIADVIVPAYESAGFPVLSHRRLTQDEALDIPSTWGRRLLHARPREVYQWDAVPKRS